MGGRGEEEQRAVDAGQASLRVDFDNEPPRIDPAVFLQLVEAYLFERFSDVGSARGRRAAGVPIQYSPIIMP